MAWTPYEGGKTVNTTGREGGLIKVDEEYAGAARIILEEGCLRAPYAITASVYGYLLHTRFLADDETAYHAVDEMKTALAEIANLTPGDDDTEEAAQADMLDEALEAFTRRFP